MIYDYQRMVEQYRRAYKKGYSLPELADLTNAPVRVLQRMMQGIWRNREPETVKNVISRNSQALSEEQIAEIVGISQPSVSNIIHEYLEDPTFRCGHFIPTKESKNLAKLLLSKSPRGALEKRIPKLYDYDKVVDQYRSLYDGGMTIRELHEKSGAPIRTLQRMMQWNAVRKNTERAKRIVELHRQGSTQIQIARTVGMWQSRVNTILKSLQEGIGNLNYRNYEAMIRSGKYDNRQVTRDALAIERDEKKRHRIWQLRALPDVNKTNYSTVSGWETLAHALRLIYGDLGKHRASKALSPAQYFEQKLGIPIEPVETLVQAYEEIDKGSAILTLPLKDVDDLIDQYYYTRERRKK
jgi:predicted XRE-type DNA-binding protein